MRAAPACLRRGSLAGDQVRRERLGEGREGRPGEGMGGRWEALEAFRWGLEGKEACRDHREELYVFGRLEIDVTRGFWRLGGVERTRETLRELSGGSSGHAWEGRRDT